MKLDTASLKPRICAICKRDLAKTASPNDCIYCVLYQTVHFCLGKRLSKRALNLITVPAPTAKSLSPAIVSFTKIEILIQDLISF